MLTTRLSDLKPRLTPSIAPALRPVAATWPGASARAGRLGLRQAMGSRLAAELWLAVGRGRRQAHGLHCEQAYGFRGVTRRGL